MSTAVASPTPATALVDAPAPLESKTALDDYVIIRPVGEGSFGKVFQARQRYSGRACAMKFIPKHGKSEKDLRSLRSEIDIMKTLDHPNVIKMLDAFETAMEFVVVMEFAQGVLFDVLEHDASLPEREVREIAIQLIDALHYLHENRVIHRDLKPQNILIGTDRVVKVCDFGFARSMSKSSLVMTSIKGTPLYMAPELVQEQPYDRTVDLWSVGVILYELYVGQPPFYTNSIYSLIQKIVKDPLKWPENMSPSFKSFLQGLLNKKPAQRLQWPSLLDHPFVRKDGARDDVDADVASTAGEDAPAAPHKTPTKSSDRPRRAGGAHGARTGGPTTASSLEQVSEGLRELEDMARKSVESAAGLRRDRGALSKLLDTLQPIKPNKFLPSYISNRTLAAKKVEAKPPKMADIASALRTTLAMLNVPRSASMSAGGTSSAVAKDLPAAVIAACKTAASAKDPPQPELLALAITVLAAIAAPDGLSPWCGLGLSAYLTLLGTLLLYPQRDVGEIVSTAAARAIADAIEAAIARGVSAELSGTRVALGPPGQRGGGVTDALCQALGKSSSAATATETCRALYAATEIGTLTSYVAVTLSMKNDATQKLIRSATTKTLSAKLLAIVTETSDDVREQAMSADGARILAAILVDETSKRSITLENAELSAAIMRAMIPLLSSKTTHPVLTMLDIGVCEAMCLALTAFTKVGKTVKDDVVYDVTLEPAANLILHPFNYMLTNEMNVEATAAAMPRYQAIVSERQVMKTIISRLRTSPRDIWPAPIALASRLVMVSPSFAAEFMTNGGLDATLCRRVLKSRDNAQIVVDWLVTLTQLARMSARNYAIIDDADVTQIITELLDHPDPNVRARACNTLGNVCRHDAYFYDEFREFKTLEKLIERCSDSDRTTRKFAAFAIGNAAFHSDALYGPLTAAVDPLVHLLDEQEEPKTRSNAAAALGNLVRNSNVLCDLMVNSGAMDALINLIASPNALSEAAGDSQSPLKIALFSLGNMCTHRVCKERLTSRNLEPLLDNLTQYGDETIKKYVTRIKQKIERKPARAS